MKDPSRERTADSPELQRLEQELRTERRWRETAVSSLAALESVLANIDSGILLFDGGGRVLYANQALSALFDIPPERIARMNREQFLREVAALAEDPILDKLKTLTAGNHPTKDDFEIQQPKWLQIGCSVKPVMVSSGRGQLVVFTNITAEVDIADSRQRLALTDELTGLSNRRAGEQAVAREVARVYRTGQPRPSRSSTWTTSSGSTTPADIPPGTACCAPSASSSAVSCAGETMPSAGEARSFWPSSATWGWKARTPRPSASGRRWRT